MPSRLQRVADRQVERIVRRPLHGAWTAAATVTLAVTVVAGVLIRLTDPQAFPNVWLGLWWAVQTTTTVGYGDVVPNSVAGRIVATFVMLGGIGFITVSTAAIASAFVEASRRRGTGATEDAHSAQLTGDSRPDRRARGRGAGEPAGRAIGANWRRGPVRRSPSVVW